MTDQDKTELKQRIKDHCEAMLAQVDDPGVKLEHLVDMGWRPVAATLFEYMGPHERCWHRLVPAPRLVPLDQGDFLGPNRVVIVREKGSPSVSLIIGVSDKVVVTQSGFTDFALLMDTCECSRDFGATWGPCSKEVK